LNRWAIDHTRINDISVLKGMPLEAITLTPQSITKGMDMLRSMTSLKGINAMTPAEFWRKYDAGEYMKK